MALTPSEISSLLRLAYVNLHNKAWTGIAQPLQNELGLPTPPRVLQDFLSHTTTLMNSTTTPLEDLPVELLPFAKRALLDARLSVANRVDTSRARVSEPETVEELNMLLAPYDELMSQPWFSRTEAVRMPQLNDFLTVERAELHLAKVSQQERQYDEKFHILQAPTLFLPDLDYYRQKCGMRNLPVIASFIDIDKFKDFNSQYGEANIDLNLLPRFMAILEAHVYARGFAYRFGGDEYAVLLPNADNMSGHRLLLDFQHHLATVRYRDIKNNPTVSIGFCEVLPDCSFTNNEILAFAVAAKTYAKSNGRNRVATFDDVRYRVPRIVA